MISLLKKYLAFTLFLTVVPAMIYGQTVIKYDDDLFGEATEFAIGVHSGIFDSNQSVTFPFNVGVVAQFNYIPDVSKKFYLGVEGGTFFTRSQPDKLGRITNLVFSDITVYPGLSFPVKTKVNNDDNYISKVKKRVEARKFRVAPGFVVIIPVHKQSSGAGVNNESITTTWGVALRMSYHMKNRLSLFGNIMRIGKDLDGYAYKGSDTMERSNGNKHDVTYIFKAGVMYKILK